MDADHQKIKAVNKGAKKIGKLTKHWREPLSEYWNVPLMEGETILRRSPNQELLTKSYTEKAVGFIRANKNKPFFLYLAHSMPHVPLFRSDSFKEVSTAGLYGDVIEEIDWSVGQVLQTLVESWDLGDAGSGNWIDASTPLRLAPGPHQHTAVLIGPAGKIAIGPEWYHFVVE